jgi:hypothetical protein
MCGEENPADKKGKCFYMPADEIKANNCDLSVSRYKEMEYERSGLKSLRSELRR